jgi:hypothetical protein
MSFPERISPENFAPETRQTLQGTMRQKHRRGGRYCCVARDEPGQGQHDGPALLPRQELHCQFRNIEVEEQLWEICEQAHFDLTDGPLQDTWSIYLACKGLPFRNGPRPVAVLLAGVLLMRDESRVCGSPGESGILLSLQDLPHFGLASSVRATRSDT